MARTLLALLFALLASVMFSASPAAAQTPPTTWYVAPDGDNTDPGTELEPFATLRHALSRVAPGDTIMLRGGTYSFDRGLWTDKSGTSSAWITIRAFPGETPVLDCQNVTQIESCFTLAGQYVEVRGLHVTNSRKSGLVVWGGDHIRLIDNTVTNAEQQGLYVSANTGTTADYVVVDGNTVHHNGQSNNPTPTVCDKGWPGGLQVSKTISATIINNHVYNNYGEGMLVASNTGSLIADNTIYENFSVNLYLDDVDNAIIERNTIRVDGSAEFLRCGDQAYGLALANERGPQATALMNNIIRNNVVIGGRTALRYSAYRETSVAGMGGGGMHNTLIAHNTFIGGVEKTVSIEADTHEGSALINNVFVQTGTVDLFSGSLTGISVAHNGWNRHPGAALGSGDVIGNLHVVTPGATDPAGYAPRPVSPLLDAGLAGYADADFLGNPRPADAGADIGAFEVARPVLSLEAAGSTTVNEGRDLLVRLRLNAPSSDPVTATLSFVAGSADSFDAENLPRTLVIPAGTTTLDAAVRIADDPYHEDAESFALQLTATSGAVGGGTLGATIPANDAIRITTVGPVIVHENAGFATVTVAASGNHAQPFNVTLATTPGHAQPGVDYGSQPITLPFAVGETTKTVQIPILEDGVAEDSEDFFVNLTNPSHGEILGGSLTVEIRPNDHVQLTTEAIAVYEHSGQAVVTLSLDAPAAHDITFTYATEAGSAQPGLDYSSVSGTGRFVAGSQSAQVTIPLLNDVTGEDVEIFALRVLSVNQGTLVGVPTTTVHIMANDRVEITMARPWVYESARLIVAEVRLQNPMPHDVSVPYRTVSGTALAGSDFFGKSGTLVIPAGSTSGWISVPVIDDGENGEGPESLDILLSKPTGASLVTNGGRLTVTIYEGCSPTLC